MEFLTFVHHVLIRIVLIKKVCEFLWWYNVRIKCIVKRKIKTEIQQSKSSKIVNKKNFKIFLLLLSFFSLTCIIMKQKKIVRKTDDTAFCCKKNHQKTISKIISEFFFFFFLSCIIIKEKKIARRTDGAAFFLFCLYSSIKLHVYVRYNEKGHGTRYENTLK